LIEEIIDLHAEHFFFPGVPGGQRFFNDDAQSEALLTWRSSTSGSLVMQMQNVWDGVLGVFMQLFCYIDIPTRVIILFKLL
jgi:hypothetical protein